MNITITVEGAGEIKRDVSPTVAVKALFLIADSTTFAIQEREEVAEPVEAIEEVEVIAVVGKRAGKPKIEKKEERQQRCGSCGKPGHSRRTCGDDPVIEKAPKKQKGKRSFTCKKCGEAGHIAKTCGREKPEVNQRNRMIGNRKPFSEPTYNVVKTLLESRTVDMVSSEKGLDIDEVRRIAFADDYRDYLVVA